MIENVFDEISNLNGKLNGVNKINPKQYYFQS